MDRGGDHRGGLARKAGLDRKLDRFDHGGGIGGVGLAGNGADFCLGGDQRPAMVGEYAGIAHQHQGMGADFSVELI